MFLECVCSLVKHQLDLIIFNKAKVLKSMIKKFAYILVFS